MQAERSIDRRWLRAPEDPCASGLSNMLQRSKDIHCHPSHGCPLNVHSCINSLERPKQPRPSVCLIWQMGKRAAAAAAARMGANSHGGEIFPQLQYSSLPPSANRLTDAAASLPAVAAGLAWSAAAAAAATASSSVGVQLDGKSRREEKRRGVLVSPETSTTVRKLDDDDDASQLATDVPGYEVILLKLGASERGLESRQQLH